MRRILLHSLIAGGMMMSAQSAAADDLSQAVARATTRIDEALKNIRKTGDLSASLPDLEKSRVELESAHTTLVSLHRFKESSLAIARAGDCLRIGRQLEGALLHYQEALGEAREAKSEEAQARAWLGIERVQRLGLHNHAAAAQAIREGSGLAENKPDLWAVWVDLLSERAELEISNGDFARALESAIQAIAGAEQHHDQERLWGNIYTRSSVYHNLADLLRQEYISLPFETERAWKRCEVVAGNVERSLALARNDTIRAASIAESLGHAFFVQNMAIEAADYQALSKSFQAISATKRQQRALVLEIEGQAGKTLEPLMATADGKLIPAELLGPALSGASSMSLQQVLSAMRQILAQAQAAESMTWRRRFLEGELAETENRIDAALDSYRQAAAMVQEERRTVADEFLRASFVAEKVQLYERLILNFLKRNQYAEALHWMEQSRARATMDMLASVDAGLQTSQTKQSYAEWLEARAKDPRANDRGKQAIPGGSPTPLEIGDSEPVNLADLQRALKETPCDLVYYILHQGRIVLWHVGPTRSSARAYVVPVSQLQSLGRSLLDSLSHEKAFNQEAAERLYFYLAKPIRELMETKHLVIVAPPELEGLPFQAFFDKDKKEFLGEQIALSYASSGSMTARLKPARALRGGNLLLMTGPDLSTGGAEVDAIAGNYTRHDIFRGAEATFANLLVKAQGRTAVHIAAHGMYDQDSPMLSSIRMAGDAKHDGQVTAAQMFALPLKGVEVFTLGSCSIGRASVDVTGETYGFARSLLYAGAQSVVLPLWEVDDQAAVFWFRSFYQNAITHDLPEAARLANVATRNENSLGSHPRSWAAYRLIGR